jgi:putative PEP-CTERM system TPR-repeat lipoprotein
MNRWDAVMYLKLMRIACGALCAALVACTGDTPDKLVESGRRYLDGNDPGAAVIQLKNALQKDPNSAEARFLLGKALLDSNDAVAAAVELRKALDLKHPEEVVLPVLARAMLAQGDSQKLIERYAATDLPTPAAAADLKTSIAIALILQGKLPQAQTALAAALAAQPEHVPALIVQARVHAGHRDLKSAFAALDKILAHKPVGADALQLKADLLRQKGDSAGALQAYREALPLARDQLAPRAGILSVLMAENDLQAARKELDDLRKELPHHPQVAYFEAELAFRKGDHKAAKEIAQQLLKVLPDNTRVLQLAGALELQERSYLRAQQMLTRALNLSPDLAGARFALAQAYLGTGDPAKVLSTLGPLLDNNPTAPVLRLAASAYMLKGELAKADELFSRVLETRPGDVRARTAMALTDLRQGDANVAFSELESIAAADTGGTADLALIGSHLGRREYDKALAAIDALERKPHGKVLGPYLRGRTYFVRGDLRQARQGLDKALAADPAFLPAVEAMAAIDVAEKKPDAAEKRFRKLLEKQPDNARALQALARLRETGGAKKDEVVDLLTRAARVSQGDPAPRLALVDYQMRQREPKQAVTVAQDAVAAFPESAEAQEALGRALLAAGDTTRRSARSTAWPTSGRSRRCPGSGSPRRTPC